MKKQIFIISVFVTSLLASGLAIAEVNVGIQASRGAVKALKKWGDVGKYLSAEIGTKVKLVALKPNVTMDAVKSGKVDYMLANPVVTLGMLEKLGTKPLLTLKKKSGPQFAGVIICGKDSGLKKAADLKGKKVMGYKFKRSAAAYVFQVKHMIDNGVDPHKDFAVFKEASKQDDIVLAVKAGAFDCGFIKSGLLEAMVKEGKAKMSDFTIIDKKSDSLAAVHSTALYPQWYFSATDKADSAVSDKLKAALLKLSADNGASKKAKISGFVEPLDLSTLKDTLKSLKLPPYD